MRGSTLRCYALQDAGMRRRLYLMRHAEVSYVGERDPEAVRLTSRGSSRPPPHTVRSRDVHFDLVVTSTLPRTVETASVVAPGREPEQIAGFDGVARRAAR